MKNVIFIAFILLTINCFGQKPMLLVDDKLYIDSLYQDKSELLLFSSVSQFDSLKKEVLIKKVKEWASTAFVNLKEVLVSETDDQMVLVFTDKTCYVKTMGIKTSLEWYIRLKIQFKDSKVKYSFYDDGNAYSGGMPTRSVHFKDYFKDDNGNEIARKPNKDGLMAVYQSQNGLVASMNKAIASKSNDGF